MTGQQRPPIPVKSVKIYDKAPENYEVIGIVRSHADTGWTQQAITDSAMFELREQAAKIGANGVIFTSAGSGDKDSVGITSTGRVVAFFDTGEKFQGTAILVSDALE